MEFKYTYLFYGLILPITLIVIAWIIGARACRKLAQKQKYGLRAVYPIILVCVFTLWFMFLFAKGYVYPLSAIIDSQSDKYLTTGYVETIEDAPLLPKYYDQESRIWSSGKLIGINGEQYYLPIGNVEQGDAIAVIWGNPERVVFECKYDVSISETEIGTWPVTQQVSNDLQSFDGKKGQTVAVSSLIVFIVLVFLQYPVGKKLSIYLEKEDAKIKKRIVPHKIGVGIFLIGLLPITGIVIGMVMMNRVESLIAFLVFGIVFLVTTIEKQSMIWKIDTDFISIKQGKKETKIAIDSITTVYFAASWFPKNRKLVIRLDNREKLLLDQMDYWGLTDAYNVLSLLLKERRQ